MFAIVLAAAVYIYPATVINVVDGDTLRLHVKGFPMAFDPIDIRIVGIDTPEHILPPAQGQCEVALGLSASSFARTLVKPGDSVVVKYTVGQNDKYRRILGTLTLSDGRDWGQVMINSGHARPYGVNGDLHKAPWC